MWCVCLFNSGASIEFPLWIIEDSYYWSFPWEHTGLTPDLFINSDELHVRAFKRLFRDALHCNNSPLNFPPTGLPSPPLLPVTWYSPDGLAHMARSFWRWPLWEGGRAGGRLTNLASCTITSYCGEEEREGEGKERDRIQITPPLKGHEKVPPFMSGITAGMIIKTRKREAERERRKEKQRKRQKDDKDCQIRERHNEGKIKVLPEIP